MNGPSTKTPRDAWGWLPNWMTPLDTERSGRGDLRRVEVTILVIVGLILAVASVNDLVRQTHINHRLIADLHTWRTVTDHDYHNVSIEQDVHHFTSSEVACGNTSPGPPESRPRVCLILTGPIHNKLRAAIGGYYLPAYVPDLRMNRYACFGTAKSARLCGLSTPPGAPAVALVKGT